VLVGAHQEDSERVEWRGIGQPRADSGGLAVRENLEVRPVEAGLGERIAWVDAWVLRHECGGLLDLW